MTLTFTILGIPQPKQSFRIAVRNGFAVKYQKKEVVENERNIKYEIASQLPKGYIPTRDKVIIKELIYTFPPTSSMKKKDLQTIENGGIVYKTTKPDLTDNLNKGLFDALQGLVFINDSQICEIRNAKKIYGLVPSIKIVMEV